MNDPLRYWFGVLFGMNVGVNLYRILHNQDHWLDWLILVVSVSGVMIWRPGYLDKNRT